MNILLEISKMYPFLEIFNDSVKELFFSKDWGWKFAWTPVRSR